MSKAAKRIAVLEEALREVRGAFFTLHAAALRIEKERDEMQANLLSLEIALDELGYEIVFTGATPNAEPED